MEETNWETLHQLLKDTRDIRNAGEAVNILCLLHSVVSDSVTGHLSPHDCFCGQGGFWGTKDYDGTYEGGYRNGGDALAWIVEAVLMRLTEKEKDAPMNDTEARVFRTTFNELQRRGDPYAIHRAFDKVLKTRLDINPCHICRFCGKHKDLHVPGIGIYEEELVCGPYGPDFRPKETE